MKNKFKLLSLFLLLALFVSQNAYSAAVVTIDTQLEKVGDIDFSSQEISFDDVMNLSTKEIQKKTGKKLKFKEKIALKIAKRQIKKARKKGLTNAEINTELAKAKNNFHWGGFALGFFAGIAGVLIAHFLIKEKAATKAAWIGFGALVVLMIIYIVAVVNSVT